MPNRKEIIADLLSKSKPVEKWPGYYWSKEKQMLWKKGTNKPPTLGNLNLDKPKTSKVILKKGLK